MNKSSDTISVTTKWVKNMPITMAITPAIIKIKLKLNKKETIL